jgi:hypothetical protein
MPFPDFAKYIEVTALSANVDSTQTDIVAWFDLSSAPASFWDNLERTDGADIRVANSDGTTEYPAYVCFIDTVNEIGLLAAKVSSMSHTANTIYRIYYGDADASAPAVTATNGRNAVFNWRWSFVFALFDTANAGTNLTGNGSDATVGSAVLNTTTNAIFGKALEFNDADSPNERLIVTNDTNVDNLSSTMTAIWVQYKEGTSNANDDPWGFESGGHRIRHQIGLYRDRVNSTQYAETDSLTNNATAVFAYVKDGVNDESVFFTNATKHTVATGVTENFITGNPLVIGGARDDNNGFLGTMSLWIAASTEIADDTVEIIHKMLRDSVTSFWSWGTGQDNPDAGGSTDADINGAGSSTGSVNLQLEVPDVDLDVNGAGSSTAQVDMQMEAPDVDLSISGEGSSGGVVNLTLEAPDVDLNIEGRGSSLGAVNLQSEAPDVDLDVPGKGSSIGAVSLTLETPSVSAPVNGSGSSTGHANLTSEAPDVDVPGVVGRGSSLGSCSFTLEAPSTTANIRGNGSSVASANLTLEVPDVDIDGTQGEGSSLGAANFVMEPPSTTINVNGNGSSVGSVNIELEVPDVDLDPIQGNGSSIGSVNLVSEAPAGTTINVRGRGSSLGGVNVQLEVLDVTIPGIRGFGSSLGHVTDQVTVVAKEIVSITLAAKVCNPYTPVVRVCNPFTPTVKPAADVQ